MFKNSGLKIEGAGEIETSATGVRKLLLLYGPEGIDGWIAHFLFYSCALAAVVLKVRGVMAAIGALHGSSRWQALIYFTSASLFVWLTYYLHDVSQRILRQNQQLHNEAGLQSRSS